MQRHLQLERPHDLRCRLAVPSVYVSRYYISWDWSPDALARWYTLMCYLVSFSKVSSLRRSFYWSTGLALETAVEKQMVGFLL